MSAVESFTAAELCIRNARTSYRLGREQGDAKQIQIALVDLANAGRHIIAAMATIGGGQ